MAGLADLQVAGFGTEGNQVHIAKPSKDLLSPALSSFGGGEGENLLLPHGRFEIRSVDSCASLFAFSTL